MGLGDIIATTIAAQNITEREKTYQLSIKYDPETDKITLNYEDLGLTDYELKLDNSGDLKTYVIQDW